MRLIDGDALVQRYEEHKELLAKNREENQEKINLLHFLTLDVKRAKKIEAEPVRHGKWLGVNPMVDTLMCSECGENIISEEFKSNYCPNCGARMEVKNEAD